MIASIKPILQPRTWQTRPTSVPIKLASELSKKSTGKTLYILDEPTTGLHFHDVYKLIEVLGSLVDKGNTVVVIEHNLDVIKTADHIIDLGPIKALNPLPGSSFSSGKNSALCFN